MHGQFVWYELTTPDVEGATKFYPRFTNWGTQRFDDDYMMWTNGGVPFAGIYRLNDQMKSQGTPPNWMPYIESSDVDATVDTAKSLGASVLAGPSDIPGTGRFAVVQDPQGAVFGVYKSVRESASWNGTPAVGIPSWHELMTHDHEKAAKFYNALFGWEKISEMDMGGGSMYYMFGHPGNANMYGGMFSMNEDFKGMHPFWLVYIHVPDVGKAVDIATRNGATVHRPQMDIPGGSIAILGDPQGAGFALHHSSPAVVAPAPKARSTSKGNAAMKAKSKAKTKATMKTKTAMKTKSKPKTRAAMKSKSKTRTKAAMKTKSKMKTKAKARTKSKRSAPAKKKAATRRPAKKKK